MVSSSVVDVRRYAADMPTVRFPWDAQLVSIRRESVPRARWDKTQRAWVMTAIEADAFLNAAHARMHFIRFKSTITIDGVVWVIGFEQGTPYQMKPVA